MLKEAIAFEEIFAIADVLNKFNAEAVKPLTCKEVNEPICVEVNATTLDEDSPVNWGAVNPTKAVVDKLAIA